MPPPECSRELILPGPQPPLSHFGATLLRQVIATALRYSLHSLGLTMPERPPLRIVRLRVYLDAAKLLEQLESGAASEELVAALVEPGGSGALPADAGALRGALVFHRARLGLGRRRAPRGSAEVSEERPPQALWAALRGELERQQTAVNDALLGELLAALARRTARHRGKSVLPCLGREAHRLRSGGRSDLGSLGIPDPMVEAWNRSPRVAGIVEERLGGEAVPPRDRLRGEFRESYRRLCSAIRPLYLSLARGAADRRLLDSPGDAFFIPFELAEDLTADRRPGWLSGAIASNRREYQNLAELGGPPESIAKGHSKEVVDDADGWILGPVWPLS